MIHLAIAGAGAWGLNHVRDLASLPGARLAWIVEPDEARRERAGALAPLARRTAEVEEALRDRRVDALVVASPTPTHVPLARAALARGKHVLVEKPLAPDAESARDLVRRARRAGRLLAVGHLLLYHPAVAALRRRVEGGALGKIRYLTGQRTNLGRVRSDEGALLGLAPHDVSVMSHLLGAWPVGVSAGGARYVQPQWEDLVLLTLRYPGGVLGHIHLSWLDPLKVRRLAVVGERAMAVFDDMDAKGPLQIFGIDAPIEAGRAPRARAGRTVATAPRAALREELRSFVRDVSRGRPSRTPGEDGVRVLQVLDAARTSLARAGQEIRVRIR